MREQGKKPEVDCGKVNLSSQNVKFPFILTMFLTHDLLSLRQPSDHLQKKRGDPRFPFRGDPSSLLPFRNAPGSAPASWRILLDRRPQPAVDGKLFPKVFRKNGLGHISQETNNWGKERRRWFSAMVFPYLITGYVSAQTARGGTTKNLTEWRTEYHF